MSRSLRPSTLTILCLTVFLALTPLVLPKPGFPTGLRADEAGYYGMALSLWHDRDLVLDNEDLTRMFQEFPTGVETLMVMSHDDWKTTYFSKPIIYPLVVAPIAGLLGANGLLSFNLLLLGAMVWMGTRYLERFNDETPALLFALGFFLLSLAFSYAFWIHPEVFDMATVATAFFLVLVPPAERRTAVRRMVAAGAILALGIFNKPLLAALVLPLVFAAGRRWGRRGAVAWLLALLAVSGALLGASHLLTRQAWPYLGVARKSIRVASPVRFVEDRLPTRGRSSAGKWMNDNPPRADARQLAEDLPYFLWGRHVGAIPYMPFGALCVALFLVTDRRCRFRWLLLLSLSLAALGLMISIPGNWHGGGDFIGNRYFVHLYPALLFFVTRIRPGWVLPTGYAVSALLLGPLLMAPFGRTVPYPGQHHVLQAPFRWLPLEMSLLGWIQNYSWAGYPPDVRFRARRDVFQVVDQEMWFLGASDLDAWLTSSEPLLDAVIDVRSLAPGNRVKICLDRDCVRLADGKALTGPTKERITLSPTGSRSTNLGSQHVYRLRVSTRRGEEPRWRQGSGSQFYLGAALAFLGTSRQLEASAVTWGELHLPEALAVGQTIRVPARVTNTSTETYFAGGAAPVKASYHWFSADGDRVVWDGSRTQLPLNLAPGLASQIDVVVKAPDRPGRYELVIDLVREGFEWFGGAGGVGCPRGFVEVAPAEPNQPAADPR